MSQSINKIFRLFPLYGMIDLIASEKSNDPEVVKLRILSNHMQIEYQNASPDQQRSLLELLQGQLDRLLTELTQAHEWVNAELKNLQDTPLQ